MWVEGKLWRGDRMWLSRGRNKNPPGVLLKEKYKSETGSCDEFAMKGIFLTSNSTAFMFYSSYTTAIWRLFTKWTIRCTASSFIQLELHFILWNILQITTCVTADMNMCSFTSIPCTHSIQVKERGRGRNEKDRQEDKQKEQKKDREEEKKERKTYIKKRDRQTKRKGKKTMFYKC